MRNKTAPILLSIALFYLSCKEKQQSREEPLFKESAALTNSLDSFKKKSLIPGFAVAIVNEKGSLYSKGFGYADVQQGIPFTDSSINWIASISKTFVGLSVMKLVEQGKLQLDEPINSILPFPVINPYFPEVPITVRHLVTHTACIQDDAFVPYYIGEADIAIVDDNKSYDSLPEYLQPNLKYYRMGKRISLAEHVEYYLKKGAKWYSDSSFLNKKPGTYFQYSNLGATVAAEIVEIRSGQSFVEFTKKNIFEPLHMENTGWNFEDLNPTLVSKIYAHNREQNPTGVVQHPQYYMTNFPVSGLKTNVVDLGLYLSEMIKGASGEGKLLNDSSYQILFRPHPPVEGRNQQDSSILNSKFSISCFWGVSAKGVRLHFGGNTGVYSFIFFDPVKKMGAVGIANLRDDSFGDLLEIVKKVVFPEEN